MPPKVEVTQAAVGTEVLGDDFTPVEILDNKSSEFPFFDGSGQEQVPISPEKLLIDVRRIDETWEDPLAGKPFEFNDELKGITTIRGFTAENLQRYTLGTLRLNLLDHGHTAFAANSPEEFIQNYESAKTEGTPMPPVTIHGIDFETGDYIVAEIPLDKFMIHHYIEIGNVV